MKAWFKRQSGARQTWIVMGVLAVLLVLAGAIAGEDEKSSEQPQAVATATGTTAARAATTATQPAEPRPRPVAAPLVATMRAAGLPAQGARDATPLCTERFAGCVERIASDQLSVLVFATAGAARAYARRSGDGARRAGTIVLSYAGEGPPKRVRLQYEAALRAFAGEGGRRSVARAVKAERGRQARVRERQRVEQERRAEARRVAQRAREEAAAAPEPVAEPEPASAPDYSGLTCSEIGTSYNVAPGSDPDHDADGDGIACESE